MTDTPESQRPKTEYYNAQMGKMSRREKKAHDNLTTLIAKFVSEGMTEPEAREKALADLRENPRQDWRAG